jgi:hypothetical protein
MLGGKVFFQRTTPGCIAEFMILKKNIAPLGEKNSIRIQFITFAIAIAAKIQVYDH